MPGTPLQLAMIGLGTVGTGVAKLLTQRPEHLRSIGVGPLQLKTIVVRDPAKVRGVDLGGARLTTDFDSIVADPQIDIVIEVMGGIEPARSRIAALLKAGKHVVTANKAVLAEHGRELFEIARQADRAILFEASVAGGIPILAALAETLSVNRIQRISGIVNGTCNYILTAMNERALPYADALKQAQHLGFAEADPTLDVNGSDAAQKLAILARLAFQSRVDWRSIRRTGIDQLHSMDIQFAAELGYVIKLLPREKSPAVNSRCKSPPSWSTKVIHSPRFAANTTPFESREMPSEICFSPAKGRERCRPPPASSPG